MNTQERAKVITEFLDTHCFPVMKSKGAEYSRGEEDCNSNFKREAEALGLTPLQVAHVYASKHWDSITNFVKTGETPSGEPIEGRIGDMLNYLLIFASLLKEENPTLERRKTPSRSDLVEELKKLREELTRESGEGIARAEQRRIARRLGALIASAPSAESALGGENAAFIVGLELAQERGDLSPTFVARVKAMACRIEELESSTESDELRKAATAVAENASEDDDWEAVRASDLAALRTALSQRRETSDEGRESDG